MSIFSREDVVKSLQESKCIVDFTKVNGEKRVMYCTLRDEDIPEDKKPKSYSFSHDTVVRAFDIIKQEWRSFRVDNLVSINTNPQEVNIEHVARLSNEN